MIEALASVKGRGVVRNGAWGGVWSITGGIPPAMPLVVFIGRVGVVTASRDGGGRRAGRGIVVYMKQVMQRSNFREAWGLKTSSPYSTIPRHTPQDMAVAKDCKTERCSCRDLQGTFELQPTKVAMLTLNAKQIRPTGSYFRQFTPLMRKHVSTY